MPYVLVFVVSPVHIDEVCSECYVRMYVHMCSIHYRWCSWCRVLCGEWYAVSAVWCGMVCGVWVLYAVLAVFVHNSVPSS